LPLDNYAQTTAYHISFRQKQLHIIVHFKSSFISFQQNPYTLLSIIITSYICNFIMTLSQIDVIIW